MSLQAGFDAAKEGRYQEAIPILEEYCRNCAEQGSAEYCTAQMWLVRGYKATGEIGKALIICQRLMLSEHQKVSDWAGKMYQKLNESPSPEAETEAQTEASTESSVVSSVVAGRLVRGNRDAERRRSNLAPGTNAPTRELPRHCQQRLDDECCARRQLEDEQQKRTSPGVAVVSKSNTCAGTRSLAVGRPAASLV